MLKSKFAFWSFVFGFIIPIILSTILYLLQITILKNWAMIFVFLIISPFLGLLAIIFGILSLIRHPFENKKYAIIGIIFGSILMYVGISFIIAAKHGSVIQ